MNTNISHHTMTNFKGYLGLTHLQVQNLQRQTFFFSDIWKISHWWVKCSNVVFTHMPHVANPAQCLQQNNYTKHRLLSWNRFRLDFRKLVFNCINSVCRKIIYAKDQENKCNHLPSSKIKSPLRVSIIQLFRTSFQKRHFQNMSQGFLVPKPLIVNYFWIAADK